MKVLIADVETDVRDQIQVGLEAFDGYSVECSHGLVALDRVRRCNYDGVFLGVVRGGEQLRRIAKEYPELPIVVLGKDAVLRQAKQDCPNVVGMLSTPLNAVEFFKTVARLGQRLQSSN